MEASTEKKAASKLEGWVAKGSTEYVTLTSATTVPTVVEFSLIEKLVDDVKTGAAALAPLSDTTEMPT